MLSILSALTATAGMLIDNIIIGRFFGTVELGAMGIIGPVSSVFSAVGNVCSGGGTTRAAQAIGKGEMKQVHGIFTITTGFAVIVGAVLSIAGLFFAPQIAGFLGATGELMQPTTEYLRGFFLGAVPTILLTMLSGFVKIDGSPRLPLLCIVVMTVCNIILDLLMAMVFHQGMFGMALATSISYCVAVLVCCTHFVKKTNTLRLTRPKAIGQELIEMVITGAPTAISRICDVVKAVVLNRMLAVWVGVGAVAVLNVRSQAHNFFGSLIMGFAMASVPIVGMFFGEEDKILATIAKDPIKTPDEALIEIYKKLRPGELPTVDAARNLFDGLFFDGRRYDLSKVGRYKYNKKLGLASRIANHIAYETIANPETGEVFVEKDEKISPEVAREIQNSGINVVYVNIEGKKAKVIGNGTVDIKAHVDPQIAEDLKIKVDVNYAVLQHILETTKNEKELRKNIQQEIVDVAYMLADKMVNKQMDEKANQAVVDEFLNNDGNI